MAMENPLFEDAFPIKNWVIFQLAMSVLRDVALQKFTIEIQVQRHKARAEAAEKERDLHAEVGIQLGEVASGKL